MKYKCFTQYSNEDIIISLDIRENSSFHNKGKIIFKKISEQLCKRYTENNKLKIIKYLGGECYHCGLKSPYPEVYDIHHLNPKKKTSKFGSSYRNFNTFKSELNDCILLCANCHRIIHQT